MIDDVRTVLWKEQRSLIHGQSRRQLVLLLGTLAFWAILFPLQTGSGWMTEGILSIVVSVLLPALVVAVTVPASFAGERERKTLSTLLATRLPDEAILIGKLVIPLTLASVVLVSVLLVGLIAANAGSWDGSPRFYDLVVIVPDLVIGFQVALAAAAAGVAISLRSRRIQDAQQTLTLMLILPALGLGAVLVVLMQLSGGMQTTADRLDGTSGWAVAAVVVLLLGLLDVVLLSRARGRFQRGRLTKDL